jgi:predicted SAM-dependent methyltransferase
MIKKLFKKVLKLVLSYFTNIKLKNNIIQNNDIKIILGAGNTKYYGWLSTNQENINLIEEKNFKSILGNNLANNFLAEHVFEHLTLEQGKIATRNCCKYLKKGGVLRIAVPDGFFPNREYINSTKPSGHGAGAYDHKVLYNYISIKKIFDKNKFKLNYLEYFDEYGKFHEKKLSTRNGFIIRSKYNDDRNRSGTILYTSLIVDAVKI